MPVAAKRLSGDAIFTIVVVIVGVAIVLFFALKPKAALSTREIVDACTTDMATQFHIHPNLKISVNGSQVTIPANVGITDGCMKPIHTHDAVGKIHVEAPVQRDFTLGDFFYVWDKAFSATALMDQTADADHEVSMFVNGEPSTEFDRLVLRDLDNIELFYGKKGEAVPVATGPAEPEVEPLDMREQAH